MLFLLEYDREKGVVISLGRFRDADAAAANSARLDREIELNRRGVRHEIVLLDAASDEDLRRTHRRYFAGIVELTSASSDPASFRE